MQRAVPVDQLSPDDERTTQPANDPKSKIVPVSERDRMMQTEAHAPDNKECQSQVVWEQETKSKNSPVQGGTKARHGRKQDKLLVDAGWSQV
jgi:hypothetical protein